MSLLPIQLNNGKTIYFEVTNPKFIDKSHLDIYKNNTVFDEVIETTLSIKHEDKELIKILHFFPIDFIQELYGAIANTIDSHADSTAFVREYELELRFSRSNTGISIYIVFGGEELFEGKLSIRTLLLFLTKLSFLASGLISQLSTKVVNFDDYQHHFDNGMTLRDMAP